MQDHSAAKLLLAFSIPDIIFSIGGPLKKSSFKKHWTLFDLHLIKQFYGTPCKEFKNDAYFTVFGKGEGLGQNISNVALKT